MDTQSGWEPATRIPLYALTGGRTVPELTLRLETQVRTLPAHTVTDLPPEPQQLLDLCEGADRSVAELAGTLHLPVPLVMVMVSDLLKDRALRMVIPHPTDGDHRTAMVNAFLAGLQARWEVTSDAGC
ncbi:DUF742 domain-containing protein [Streptomyces clavuligerus]|uniref:DUF742 domain-containing protein n=2 Tax=Streptomyces clavuligerus TaxID=1901 RepID=UPI00020D9283|nr:DUF742 domain-containing protein [Streptomyces clavuligerus]WDN55964.1 DUF742 domain-containing protein [Streptomyces clavuligerus]